MGWFVMNLKLIHDTMYWGDVKLIKVYTQNSTANKAKKAKKVGSIMLAGVQYMHNYIQGLGNQSAYDAASIIFCDTHWMRHRHESFQEDDNGNKIVPKIGTTYYINFGNNYGSELSYFHYGLCIGKIEEKYLIIPMRTGTDVFYESFHPKNNINGNKKYRQGLEEEGFEKNCILMMNDMKYISPARIDKEGKKISKEVVEEIQYHAFSISYPYIKKNEKLIERLNYTIEKQKKEIIELKNKNNTLNQKLNKNH